MSRSVTRSAFTPFRTGSARTPITRSGPPDASGPRLGGASPQPAMAIAKRHRALTIRIVVGGRDRVRVIGSTLQGSFRCRVSTMGRPYLDVNGCQRADEKPGRSRSSRDAVVVGSIAVGHG